MYNISSFVSNTDIVRNIGVMFYSAMSLTTKVNNTAKTSFGKIRKLSMIWKSLISEATGLQLAIQ